MRFLKIILLLLITCSLNVYAQKTTTRKEIKINLIKERILAAKHDSDRVNLLKQWSDIAFLTNFEEDLWLQNEIIFLCEFNLDSTLEINTEKWFKEELWIALDHIGSIYFYEYKNSLKALKYYIPSAQILEELNHLNSSSITYDIIGNIYQELGKYKLANNFFQKRIKIDDRITAKFSIKHQSDSIQIAFEKQNLKEQEILTQKANELNEETEKVLFMFEIGVAVAIVFLIIVIVFLIIVYYQWKKTRSQNIIIENQHKQLDESHREITDSINYAKNIQDAMMTSRVYLQDVLPKSFILFRPKDVVSGDYYWVYKTPYDNIYFTVADCTGHGVPGAFMSMIGTSLLNENIIEKKINNPGKVLDNMREKIIDSLNDKDSKRETRDGMDIALCKLNFEKLTVEYAGANNPLVHIRDGEINHIKANYQPVALTVGEKKPFTNHEIKLKKGDMLYIYSDGFADQFGGEKGKKYMVTKFRNLLAEISSLNVDDQKQKLEDEFEKWKGSHDQIDDVCIMGVRI
jgi:serine phosphatase RsbU (regulator of sigma subunit)